VSIHAEQKLPMHTLGDMAKALNRSPVYLHGLQTRFELPVSGGAGREPLRVCPLKAPFTFANYYGFCNISQTIRQIDANRDSRCPAKA